MSTVELLEFQ